jgi:hypothetical protein
LPKAWPIARGATFSHPAPAIIKDTKNMTIPQRPGKFLMVSRHG